MRLAPRPLSVQPTPALSLRSTLRASLAEPERGRQILEMTHLANCKLAQAALLEEFTHVVRIRESSTAMAIRYADGPAGERFL
jgi:hypothetical protein